MKQYKGRSRNKSDFSYFGLDQLRTKVRTVPKYGKQKEGSECKRGLDKNRKILAIRENG